MKVLLTGGAGYIGSHTCIELLEAGHDVVVFDNYANSSPIAIKRVETLTGKAVPVIVDDVLNEKALTKAISKYRCEAVIHFAGLKAVGESVEQPLKYYINNVAGAMSLIKAMQTTGLKSLVFSSSATVYGNPQQLPLNETHPLSASNPYGRSKLIVEDMLRDCYRSDQTWKISILRYFNPIGAHPSGLIGEDPKGSPNNLMPFVTQVAAGKREKLAIWGGDYPTPDGTGVRDYIHVVDLAKGHLKALEALEQAHCDAINLGTGQGYSVLEVIKAFELASACTIPYQISARRPGDVASCYADPTKAANKLQWKAELDLNTMCRDSWNWQQKNPNGYKP